MTIIQDKKEYIHSWYLVVMTFFTLILLLLSKNLWGNSFLGIFILFLYIKNGLGHRTCLKLFFIASFFSSMFLLLNLFYPAKEFRTGEIIQWGFMSLYKMALLNGLTTFAKIFILSFVSMASSYAIAYTRVILYLIIHNGLKVFWGYPLLIALNSIFLFKEEFDRMRLSARIRNLGWRDQVFIIFPLLVFAIRHSQRGALSLVTRGLNPNKSFYFGHEVTSRDKVILLIFFIVYTLVVAFIIKFR